jgi:hypothetical protein
MTSIHAEKNKNKKVSNKIIDALDYPHDRELHRLGIVHVKDSEKNAIPGQE